VPSPAAPNFRFADLESLDDVTLARVLRNVEPATALVALAGASHALVQRILRQLPAREAGQLHRQMQQLGPLRLDDVERAQAQLAEAARALLHPQAVSPGGRQRFAAAA
jgi:flagellar motor switch protein FliG